MSKAEDLSKQYRDYREQCGIKDPIMLDEIEEAYFEGYHQAEKDLDLSWEDLATIEKLGDDFVKQNHTPMSNEEFYKEVLKRFKDFKERKEEP